MQTIQIMQIMEIIQTIHIRNVSFLKDLLQIMKWKSMIVLEVYNTWLTSTIRETTESLNRPKEKLMGGRVVASVYPVP